ncbi:MAG: GNAT family N-acetyltransferase [Candidatus Binatia bacterium]
MMANAELCSGRVRLRNFRPEDIDDVFSYASDPLVTRYAGWEPHRSPYDSMTYIRRCLADDWGPVTFAVEYVPEGRVIGVVDIRIISRLWGVGEIGYTLGRRYWGQGLNVEAGRLLIEYGFQSLGLRRIQAVCDTDNRRSYRTMEKLGMVRERVVPRAIIRNGRPVDRFVYSILRREWMRRVQTAAAMPDSSLASGLQRRREAMQEGQGGRR